MLPLLLRAIVTLFCKGTVGFKVWHLEADIDGFVHYDSSLYLCHLMILGVKK